MSYNEKRIRKQEENLLKKRSVDLCWWITSGQTQVAPTVIDGLQFSVKHLTCVRCRDKKADSAYQIGCREYDTDCASAMPRSSIRRLKYLI